LKDLSANGYWSRTWIIQELALCRRLKLVHCGPKFLPWDNFDKVFGNTVFHECMLRSTGADTQEIADVAFGAQNLQTLSHFGKYPGFWDPFVFGILSITDPFLATDPRDKVYGILALSKGLRELVPHPNYAESNSKELVFRDLTKAMLDSGYNLDLICYKHPTHVNQPGVVSWVPDWSVREKWVESPHFLHQAIWIKHFRGTYSADAGKDAVISYVGDGSVFTSSGYFLRQG